TATDPRGEVRPRRVPPGALIPHRAAGGPLRPSRPPARGRRRPPDRRPRSRLPDAPESRELPMNRREWLNRTAALAIGCASGGRLRAQDQQLPEPTPERLPRWRGFNLLSMFMVANKG